jgi:hypothetical protein
MPWPGEPRRRKSQTSATGVSAGTSPGAGRRIGPVRSRGFRHAGHGRYFGTAADSGRPGRGTRMEIRDADGGAHQRRRASRNGDGPCTLTNVASGRALEGPAGQSAHGAPVRIRDSTHGADRHPNFR